MSALEALFSPGNPAALSCVEDLGQRLCVPAFRLVCLFQAMAIIVREFSIDILSQLIIAMI